MKMSIFSIFASMMTFVAVNVYAIDIDKITCITDKAEYNQGEIVQIKIENNSNEDINIVDRKYLDGGFVTIEKKSDNGTWKVIELYVVANIMTFKTLKKGESFTYTWNTKGYNKSDTIVNPGVYRIKFNNGLITNQFSIIAKVILQ